MGWQLRAAIVTAVAVFAVASCQEPTSVELDVRTTLLPQEVHTTQFFVGPDPETVESRVARDLVTAQTNHAESSGFIGTLVVVPESGDDDARLSVVVILDVTGASRCTAANDYRGCIVARRALSYRGNERLHVPILLEPACIGVPCDVATTCAKGSCISSAAQCDDGGACELPASPVIVPGGTVDPRDGAIEDAAEAGRDDANSTSDALVDGRSDAPTASDGHTDGPMSTGLIGFAICPPSGNCDLANQRCCTTAGAGSCAPPTTPCPPPAMDIRCDGPEDCGVSGKCCLSATGTYCLASCPSGEQLCNSGADCTASKPSCTGTFAIYYKRCE